MLEIPALTQHRFVFREEVSTLIQGKLPSLCATSPTTVRKMSMDQRSIFALLGISCPKSNAPSAKSAQPESTPMIQATSLVLVVMVNHHRQCHAACARLASTRATAAKQAAWIALWANSVPRKVCIPAPAPVIAQEERLAQGGAAQRLS